MCIRDSAQADFIGSAAKPGKLCRIEGGGCRHQEGSRSDGAPERPDHRSVLGGDGIKEAGRPQTSGTGEILRHDGWPAWDIFRHVARHDPPVEIVAAPNAEPDEKGNVLALVEVFNPHGMRGRRQCRAGEDGSLGDQVHETCRHYVILSHGAMVQKTLAGWCRSGRVDFFPVVTRPNSFAGE